MFVKWLPCIVIASLLTACSKPVPNTLNANYVANQNYSAVLAKWDCYPLDQPLDKIPADVMPFMEMHWQSIGKSIPDRAFTPLEKKRLGVLVDRKNRNKLLMDSLFSEVAMFVANTGRLPKDSEDFLANLYLSQKNVRVMAAHPNTWNADSVNVLVMPLVNPATGKPYDNFQSKVWTPFGINMQVTHVSRIPSSTYAGRLKNFATGVKSNLHPSCKYSAEITVEMYGEQPGSVLYTDTLHMN